MHCRLSTGGDTEMASCSDVLTASQEACQAELRKVEAKCTAAAVAAAAMLTVLDTAQAAQAGSPDRPCRLLIGRRLCMR